MRARHKGIIIFALLVILAIGGAVFWQLRPEAGVELGSLQTATSGSRPAINLSQLRYEPRGLPFEHRYDKAASSPLIGSALADLEGDGVDEVFLGGGAGQNDAWFGYTETGFRDITSQVGWQKLGSGATYGAAAIDYDRDGDTDLFTARVDGVFYAQNDGGRFAPERKVEASLEETAVPTGLAFADLNGDGEADLFVSTYLRHDLIRGTTIFNDESHGTQSKLLLGRGGLAFEDVTEAAGLSYRHNTFAGTFADLDNDGDADLAVAYDTGEARLYQNQGGARFALVPGTPWENRYGFPMGIGVGDLDADGLLDLFFSNAGDTLPDVLLRGDLRGDQELLDRWTLYRNEGGMRFRDESERINLSAHEFAWGGLLADFDQNGRDDLIVSENYVKIPQLKLNPLPGRVFIQDASGSLQSAEAALGLENPRPSLSSLLADWNRDGILDVLWVNIDGPSAAFMSRLPEPMPSAAIAVPAEASFVGSRWSLAWADGSVDRYAFVPSEGLGSSQSHRIVFYSRPGEEPRVTVERLGGGPEDGTQYYQPNP